MPKTLSIFRNSDAPTRRTVLASGLALAACLAWSAPAPAASLQDLRASGAVGEGYDGFVHVRPGGGAAAKAVADSTNAQRRAIYEKRARQQGISIEQVGRVYAKTIFDSAPAGTWFLTENGAWARK